MSSFEIELTDKIIPDAYHGTSKENAKKILDEGFKISRGEKLFLGDGVYFFESSRQEAVIWAKRSLNEDSIAIIRAIINLGRCLDLHNPEYLTFIYNFAENLRQEMERRRKLTTRPVIAITDSLVLNLIARKVQIDTIRGSRTRSNQRQKMFATSRWFGEQQLIICVRNLDNILRIKVA